MYHFYYNIIYYDFIKQKEGYLVSSKENIIKSGGKSNISLYFSYQIVQAVTVSFHKLSPHTGETGVPASSV